MKSRGKNPKGRRLSAAALALAAAPAMFAFGGEIGISACSPVTRPLTDIGLGEFPAEGVVERVLAGPTPEGWRPSGADRRLYLDLMEPLVAMGATWVDRDGAVIDPVIHKEWNQATPRFASSAAVLLKFGRLPEVKEPAFRAMTRCAARLRSPECRGSSPDFWMRELVTAYLCLDGIVPADLREQWRRDLAAVEPEAIYAYTDPTHTRLKQFHNWAVYSASGESMRQRAGIGASRPFLWGDDFFDLYMTAQMGRITPYGMYRDPNDPMTYDITTRLQFASALAFGYNGKLRPVLEEILRRGNLSLLLFTAPQGFVPYGGRSSQFNFQEAMTAALCELEARRYKESNPALASALKRQAHLCALAIKPWVFGATPPRHIKNLFPPETLHGCDSYGQYSVYSQLLSSFLGLAAIYADDSIPEGPAPSEIGGYVFATGGEAFHKVFASCHGTYVEIDTAADAMYDATGIGRILLPGLPGVLPLGMPFSAKPHYTLAPGLAAVALPLAIGPEWDREGSAVRLAQLSEGLACEVTASEQTRDRVRVTTTYSKDATKVVETCLLEKGGVELACTVAEGGAAVKPLRYLFPVIQSDGAKNYQARLSAGKLTVALDGRELFVVSWPEGAKASLAAAPQANRNGVFQMLVLEFPDGRAILRIAAAGDKE